MFSQQTYLLNFMTDAARSRIFYPQNAVYFIM